jgi:hypothetical protein
MNRRKWWVFATLDTTQVFEASMDGVLVGDFCNYLVDVAS